MNTESIECWFGQLDASVIQSQWQFLDVKECAHAEAIKNPRQRDRYVMVRSCLRQILAFKLSVSPEAIRFSKAEHGKPYLTDYPELAFNLSHTADHWAIAVGWQCRVGIDIEIVKPRISLAGLVEKCFAEPEAAYWHSLPEAQQIAEFYRFWTRKEAFTKATGRGIALGLTQCVINPDKPIELLSVPDDYLPASGWQLRDLTLENGILGAVAVDNKTADIRIMENSFIPIHHEESGK